MPRSWSGRWSSPIRRRYDGVAVHGHRHSLLLLAHSDGGFVSGQSSPAGRRSLDLKGLYANSPVSLGACLLIGVANGAWGTLGAVYGARIGISTPEIALMMSLVVVAGAAMQMPIGRISDMTDRRYVLAAGSCGRRPRRPADLLADATRGTGGDRHDRLPTARWPTRSTPRRRACERPCARRGFRQGLQRPAPALWLWHHDRPGPRLRTDELYCGRRGCLSPPPSRISPLPLTPSCVSAAAPPFRSATAKPSRRCQPTARRRKQRGWIRAQATPKTERVAGLPRG